MLASHPTPTSAKPAPPNPTQRRGWWRKHLWAMSQGKKPCCQSFPNSLLQVQNWGENQIAGSECWLSTKGTQGLPARSFYTEKDLENSSPLFFIHPLIFTLSYSLRDFNTEVNTHLNPFIHLFPQTDSWPSPFGEHQAVADCSASNPQSHPEVQSSPFWAEPAS